MGRVEWVTTGERFSIPAMSNPWVQTEEAELEWQQHFLAVCRNLNAWLQSAELHKHQFEHFGGELHVKHGSNLPLPELGRPVCRLYEGDTDLSGNAVRLRCEVLSSLFNLTWPLIPPSLLRSGSVLLELFLFLPLNFKTHTSLGRSFSGVNEHK